VNHASLHLEFCGHNGSCFEMGLRLAFAYNNCNS
jgi:hypothetical protein